MRWLIEILLGLHHGFLSRKGDLSLTFDPVWPGQNMVGAATWNFFLVALAIALVVFLYRNEGKALWAKRTLAGLRLAILCFLITLLNRPNLKLVESRTEPSVLAILVDDSVSMRIQDMEGANHDPESRLDAVKALLSGGDQSLLKQLSKAHQLRLYRFDDNARPLAARSDGSAGDGLDLLQPDGGQTRLIESIKTVASDLKGQQLAGVVVLSDGRPTEDAGNVETSPKDLGIKIFGVPVGTASGLKSLEIDSVQVLPSVFVGDMVNFRVMLRGAGLREGQTIKLRLTDSQGDPILEDDKPVVQSFTWEGKPQQLVELQYVPQTVGKQSLLVAIDKIDGNIDRQDNARSVQIDVMDAHIRVLYVEGYPRWEYRYLRQELIRDKTIDCSLLLYSADSAFFQEGDVPITRFPETMEELMAYDVVLFGDIDKQQITDDQLQLVHEFVAEKGGGFGMIAGPLNAPISFKGTPIEPLLPVDIRQVAPEPPGRSAIVDGWRPMITQEGRESSIFRFYRDPALNEKFITEKLQNIYWYCRGVVVKPGIGTVLAQHPLETGPDGRPAPLVVLGRFGSGRTLFSAIDDSWRWRYYDQEQVFSSYWVQTLRHLARGRKLGQSKITVLPEKPAYTLGATARVSVRVLDPELIPQLSPELRVELVDAQGQNVHEVQLLRRSGSGDLFTGSFTADRVGRFGLRLSDLPAGLPAVESPIEVTVPRLELADPSANPEYLQSLADESGGASVRYDQARAELFKKIPSAERSVPVPSQHSLWDAPLGMALFVLLITTEWVIRKYQGLV